MSFYSRKGDKGTSKLIAGKCLPKNDQIFETLGTVDELSAFIGLARSVTETAELKNKFHIIQTVLHRFNAEVANVYSSMSISDPIHNQDVEQLELWISDYEQSVQMPEGFTFPGNTLIESTLDICRTVARRAERRLVGLSQQFPEETALLLKYLNRLSSFLYIARLTLLQK